MLADVVEKQLFSTVIVEVKARRVVAPRCPECGRRGYHVKICRRRSLLHAGAAPMDELELRWAYVARLVWSNNESARASSRRGAPAKGVSMRAT